MTAIRNDADWPDKVADQVDKTVQAVKNATVVPVQKIATALVFGVLALVAVSIVGILLTIGFLRLLNSYAFPGRVWITYFVIGGLFSAGGLFLWTKRQSKDSEP